MKLDKNNESKYVPKISEHEALKTIVSSGNIVENEKSRKIIYKDTLKHPEPHGVYYVVSNTYKEDETDTLFDNIDEAVKFFLGE